MVLLWKVDYTSDTCVQRIFPVEDRFGFITLQSCLEEILLSNRGNKYKIPHMGKKMLVRLGSLPGRITPAAHACCVVAGEVMGELDGGFEDDAEGAVESAGGK
jgi:hypothetical protein